MILCVFRTDRANVVYAFGISAFGERAFIFTTTPSETQPDCTLILEIAWAIIASAVIAIIAVVIADGLCSALQCIPVVVAVVVRTAVVAVVFQTAFGDRMPIVCSAPMAIGVARHSVSIAVTYAACAAVRLAAGYINLVTIIVETAWVEEPVFVKTPLIVFPTPEAVSHDHLLASQILAWVVRILGNEVSRVMIPARGRKCRFGPRF
jgi:hypothetical protein